jgi:hypothetical protein
MTHYSRLSKIVIDVPPAEHDRELAFWSSALGQPLTRFDNHPEYHGALLHGTEFGLRPEEACISLMLGPVSLVTRHGREMA